MTHVPSRSAQTTATDTWQRSYAPRPNFTAQVPNHASGIRSAQVALKIRTDRPERTGGILMSQTICAYNISTEVAKPETTHNKSNM